MLLRAAGNLCPVMHTTDPKKLLRPCSTVPQNLGKSAVAKLQEPGSGLLQDFDEPSSCNKNSIELATRRHVQFFSQGALLHQQTRRSLNVR